MGDRYKNKKIGKVMWLMIFISAALLMPLSVAGKYSSGFSQIVDIVVYPALTMEGIPEDGAVINDAGLNLKRVYGAASPSQASPSQASPSQANPSQSIPSQSTPSQSTPCEATYSQLGAPQNSQNPRYATP